MISELTSLPRPAILAAGALTSAICVFVIIAKARDLGLMQAPVARSSHVRPTPTGGGIGIVAGTLLAGLLLPGGSGQTLSLLLLGALLAALGLFDDWRPLPARVRLPVQALIVLLAIWITGGTAAIAGDSGAVVQLGAGLLLLLGGLWWVNLFNFMDGIDGIAGQQTVMMMISAMAIAALGTPAALESWTWWLMAATASATAAFLLFNLPPARIFMGDAGSTFLGFVIVAIAMKSLVAGWLSLPQWLILSALFASDATVTLIIRYLRGENIAEAHRSHAYQRLARRFGGARPVTLSAFGLNLLVILPLALLARDTGFGLLAVLLVYLATAALALLAGAGLPDHETAGIATYRRLLKR
ncbi:Fuc2NAc and GlcNAc transferase [Neorhizobium galegae]|uniref:MraY family glycosyltransferase n=1 Tax=Neorhizobium galegae TaxID=399 RepID=UPI001AE54BF9|nr:Fuc2NAc and GlcNAc transferase [Neorhizobium galegae]